jgi:hypothetical protein
METGAGFWKRLSSFRPDAGGEAMTPPQVFSPSSYYPDDLKMLTRVCGLMRVELGHESGSDGAKAIADRAFALFASGVSDEADLLQKLRQKA